MPNSTLITDYVGRGLLSARPTTPNIPAGATAFYYATDNQTMYQWTGTAWATMSYGAGADAISTNESLSSTSYTNLATVGPQVTLTTKTSVVVWLSAVANKPSGAGNTMYVSVAVSGATTIAASDANATICAEPGVNFDINLSRVLLLTGLTAGTNTFTMKYRVDGSTFQVFNRGMAVLPL